MAIDIGAGSALGVGEESTHGTPVSRSVWWPTATISGVEVVRPVVVSSRLYDGVTDRESFVGTESTSFTVDGELHYEGLGLLFKHALGAVATVGTASPYVHTYTAALTLPAGLTMEVVSGTATNSEVFEGCQITDMTLTWAHGQAMTYSLGVSAETSAARASAGAKGSVVWSPVLGDHLDSSGVAWNSKTIVPESITLNWANNLDVDVRRLGKTTRDQPVRSGRAMITLTAEVPYEDDGLYTDFRAETASDLNLTMEKSSTAKFAVKLANAKILSVSKPIGGVGRQTQTVVWQGFAAASEGAFSVIVTNTQSSGIA